MEIKNQYKQEDTKLSDQESEVVSNDLITIPNREEMGGHRPITPPKGIFFDSELTNAIVDSASLSESDNT